MKVFLALTALWLGSIAANTAPAAPVSPPSGCSDAPFHLLDFWLGTWKVAVGAEYAGTDIVSSELDGCAVAEKWTDADGSRGRSLFFYDAFAGKWQQIWITDRATRVGGLKYKTLVATFPDGSVRFQGLLPTLPGKALILDRTTLSPLHDGTVHQVIEISKDGGTTWLSEFDAIYRREKP